MARRQMAARVSAGGRTTSDAATARATATSRPMAATCPAGPVMASRGPGSGLAPRVGRGGAPRGNATGLLENAGGPGSNAGARPASAGCDRRAVRASPRQISASTGGSVMPTASGSAQTGEATASTTYRATDPRQEAQRLAPCGMPRLNATANTAADAAASQGLGSPTRPGSPAALGMPKIAIPGRYGL